MSLVSEAGAVTMRKVAVHGVCGEEGDTRALGFSRSF